MSLTLEQQLADANRKIEILMENMPGGFFTYDANTAKLLELGNGLLDMFGCDEQTLRDTFYNSFDMMIYKEDRAQTKESIAYQSQTEGNIHVSFRIKGMLSDVMYVEYRGRKVQESNGDVKFYVVLTDVTEQILAKNLTTNYPPTPYSVAELYCGIVECIYSADTTEAQLEALVKMERELFDKEFAEVNSYESLLEATKEELQTAKEKKLVFTGYILDKASNVSKWKKDGKDYASIMFQFMSKSDAGSGESYRNLILRKDAAGRYKILGWETADTENK